MKILRAAFDSIITFQSSKSPLSCLHSGYSRAGMNKYQKETKRMSAQVGIALLVIFIFATSEICQAGSIFKGFKEKQPVEITQARVDKGKQEKQKKRLMEFYYEIFEDNITVIDDVWVGVSLPKILEQFGKPVKIEREEIPHPDPGPNGPFVYRDFTWYFDGLLLHMREDPDSKDNKSAILFKSVVTSPMYSLKHGLKIGQPASHFMDVLGIPTEQGRDFLSYTITDPHLPQYEISIGFDKERKVQSVSWELGGDY